ncbi:MAG TPA: DUF4388 domain-containing protein [Polyangiaceae bacterium]|nr:DUF4388 domain-containing protein [Polyangiaceae bacterium]
MTPHLEAGGDTGNREEGGSLIFVSDASAEAERLTTALRGRGYPVIDVPLGLLVSRVAVQQPSLILCDADAPGALETIQRVREAPGGTRVDVVFLGEPGRTVEQNAAALQQEASGVFVRPVDEFILLRKVEALIGAPTGRHDFNLRTTPTNRAPVLVAATRRPYRYDAGKNDVPRDPPSSPSSPLSSAPSHPAPATSPGTEPGSASVRHSEIPESQPHSSRPAASSHLLPPRPQELPQAKLSPALESLLATAERRVLSTRTSSIPPSDRLSPEAELEAILPADVLDALDEPLDFDDDDDDDDSSIGTHNGDAEPGPRSATKTTGAGTAGGGSNLAPEVVDSLPLSAREKTATPRNGTELPPPEIPDSQSSRATEPPATPPRHTTRMRNESEARATLEAPALSRASGAVANITAHGPITDLPPSAAATPSESAASLSTVPPAARAPERAQPDRSVPSLPTTPPGSTSPLTSPLAPPLTSPLGAPESRRDAPKLELPASLGAGDAVRALARVVRTRYTGALAFEDATGIRRVVFRDGDFVTAASGADGESLVAFLTQRGDLPADVAARIGRKLPQFGRHAGAALIAQGHLRQEDLWPVLRAHAEWLVGRIVVLSSGAVSVEGDVPVRLQAEPAVFGGATGAEVLLEIVRRVVSSEQALQRLGGPNTVLQKGDNPTLLGECALPDAEAAVVRAIDEEPLSETLRRAGHKDFAAVLYILVELSVLGRASGERRPARERQEKPVFKPDPLDHAALRARILARKALSEEGDYFALLGVARNATSYDIRRAYAALKDQYDPSRILTHETVDLRDDVELILEVLAEAFEILEDDLRRERYRRALDASP